jgi:hypothetical protein
MEGTGRFAKSELGFECPRLRDWENCRLRLALSRLWSAHPPHFELLTLPRLAEGKERRSGRKRGERSQKKGEFSSEWGYLAKNEEYLLNLRETEEKRKGAGEERFLKRKKDKRCVHLLSFEHLPPSRPFLTENIFSFPDILSTI